MSSKVSNRRLAKIETTDSDFYPTPAWGTKALMYYELFEGSIDEICCGEGDMSKELEKKYKVNSFDIMNRGYGSQEDFLQRTRRASNVCTNPPFNIATQILEKALEITDRKICLLLRTAFMESITRYPIFKYYPPIRVWTFAERLSMYPKGYEVKGGGTTSYSWFIWDLSKAVSCPELHWIRPGFKHNELKRFIYGKKRHDIL